MQNHETMRFGESQKLLGGVLEHVGPQGCPRDENYTKRAWRFPSSGTQLGAFWDVCSIICSFSFSFVCLIDLSGIWLPCWVHFGAMFGDVWSSLADFLRKGRFYKNISTLVVFTSCC